MFFFHPPNISDSSVNNKDEEEEGYISYQRTAITCLAVGSIILSDDEERDPADDAMEILDKNLNAVAPKVRAISNQAEDENNSTEVSSSSLAVGSEFCIFFL